MRKNGVWLAAIGIAVLSSAATAQDAQDDAAIKQFEQRFGAQFRQLYRSELHFMRLVCQPTRQQFERILAEGASEKAIVKKLASTMRDRQMGRLSASGFQDPRKVVTDRLARSLRPTLSAEQAARYQKELDKRAQAMKRAALLSLLVRIDEALFLSAEQRARLGEILESNWNDSWANTQWIMQGNRLFPQLPDNKILPLLSENQRAVWRAAPKGNYFSGFNFAFLRGVEIPDEVWGDEVPAARRGD